MNYDGQMSPNYHKKRRIQKTATQFNLWLISLRFPLPLGTLLINFKGKDVRVKSINKNKFFWWHVNKAQQIVKQRVVRFKDKRWKTLQFRSKCKVPYTF